MSAFSGTGSKAPPRRLARGNISLYVPVHFLYGTSNNSPWFNSRKTCSRVAVGRLISRPVYIEGSKSLPPSTQEAGLRISSRRLRSFADGPSSRRRLKGVLLLLPDISSLACLPPPIPGLVISTSESGDVIQGREGLHARQDVPRVRCRQGDAKPAHTARYPSYKIDPTPPCLRIRDALGLSRSSNTQIEAGGAALDNRLSAPSTFAVRRCIRGCCW